MLEDSRYVFGRKVRHRAVVGEFSCISNRGWGDKIVLADLPGEVVLAVRGNAFEIAMTNNKAGKAAQHKDHAHQGRHPETWVMAYSSSSSR